MFSLWGITVSLSRLDRAICTITPLFCILFHAQADFKVKTGPNLQNPPEKSLAALSFFSKSTSYQKYTLTFSFLRAPSRFPGSGRLGKKSWKLFVDMKFVTKKRHISSPRRPRKLKIDIFYIVFHAEHDKTLHNPAIPFRMREIAIFRDLPPLEIDPQNLEK